VRANPVGTGVAGAVVLGTTVLVVGALTPGYSQLGDTVSRLGSPGQPYAVLARVGVVLYGLLVIAGAGSLGLATRHRRRVLRSLVRVYGAAAVLAGVVPKDLPGTPHTLASRLHVDATIVGGLALLAAMVLVARTAPASIDRWTAAVTAASTIVSLVVFRLSWGSATYGLAERVSLGLAVLWIVAVERRSSVLVRTR